MIHGNAIGNTAPIKTLTIVDENNNEYVGIVTGSEVVFTAGPGDIRLGLIAGTEEGITEGTREIFQYRTEKGIQLVMPGDNFYINMPDNNMHQYTELQCMIAPLLNNYTVEKTVIDNAVYSTFGEKIADITVNNSDKTINLNIVNDTENDFIIYYFMYREEI